MDKSSHRRAPVRGPEEWKVEGGVTFSQWDRWFLTVVASDRGGSWLSLEAELEGRRRGHGFEREDAEAKLSHLADLRKRLQRVGVSPAELLGDDVRDRGLLRKARTKVLGQHADERFKTKAMRETPRRVLGERACRGNWTGFRVSPSGFERELLDVVKQRGRYGLNATFGLRRRLQRTLRQLDRENGGDPAERLALHRAFLSAVLQAIDRANDSCGVLGELFQEELGVYVALPWRDAGLTAETYYRDFLEFAVWEDYGLTWRRLRGFFESIDERDQALVEGILRSIRQELIEAGLEYQAERALTLLGELHVARRNYGAFVPLAREMGSREWERITEMAGAARAAGRRELAFQVFTAANQPGPHRDYLGERCRELTGRMPRDAPHLSLLD